MRLLLAVALGGALGAVARHAASSWVQAATGGVFPWGTLAVNVAGSFALGFLLIALEGGGAPDGLRPFLAVGVLGSFTTFSTFSYDTVALFRDGEPARAGAYALGSVLLAVAAALAGMAVAARG